MSDLDETQLANLASQIKDWGQTLGFSDVGISDCDLSQYEPDFFDWLEQGRHGTLDYMQRHGTLRTRPAELVPGTVRIISVRINYFDANAYNALQQLHQPEKAYISRYALGKDYHKVLRKRLQKLAKKIAEYAPQLQFRAFTDSAPVLEQAIAAKAGLGFIGKNSLIIHPRAGSWFFLGELYINLPLPVDTTPLPSGCGPCTACLDECPTQAILPNNQIDARRCISYLTIEYDGVIEEALRPLIGNRIYGCDDCQLVCPWNRFAAYSQEGDFTHRHLLDKISLLELFNWDEHTFLNNFEGSPIRRIGYAKWTRNLAIALGNLNQKTTPKSTLTQALNAVNTKINTLGAMVDAHLNWAQQRLNEQLQTTDAQSALTNIGIEVLAPQDIQPFKVRKYHYPKNRGK
ncbi:epoxyqueuosine reductase [Thiosulfatimonas sediminis]|uniref:Epoxyqueuosine reductase n=1 Tax=Thiosulfatimonas sediminis TaxID=2675054 RepID=A0A6F8PU84_9GAMM|nr:tRNA epoxyqueuosine(34) reductase QueG [Thiosulfatimonas sediminis]BBP45669.1 epoxyqueuosine reductase [Thiosulfatimonas sediminis]